MSNVSEYQQVAALVCLDLDVIESSIKDGMSDSELRNMVEILIEDTKKLKVDKLYRDSRYNACQTIFDQLKHPSHVGPNEKSR